MGMVKEKIEKSYQIGGSGGKKIGLKDELPRSVGAQYATGEEWRNNSRKNEKTESNKNNTQLWV